MPVVNKTKSQFLVLPLPSWWIGTMPLWPTPFTSDHLQEALDKLEEFLEGPTVWQAVKDIFLSMPLSSFTSAQSFADVIEQYCLDNDLTAWAVEDPQ